MMDIQVCVGSSCHIKGSALIIRQLQDLIKAGQLDRKIRLKASFCMDDCKNGVCVTIDGEKITGVHAANIEAVFNEKVLGRIKA